MSDMGWTNYDAEVEAVEYGKFGKCLACGGEMEGREEVEVSNGPNEPILGVVHEDCLEREDPQELRGADHYHIDYPDFIINDIGERER